MSDRIFIERLAVRAVVGADAWERGGKRQPVLLTVHVWTDVRAVGRHDRLVASSAMSMSSMSSPLSLPSPMPVNYGTLAKQITEVAERVSFSDLQELAVAIADEILRRYAGGGGDGGSSSSPCSSSSSSSSSVVRGVRVLAVKPKALLHADGASISIDRGFPAVDSDTASKSVTASNAATNDHHHHHHHPQHHDDRLCVKDLEVDVVLGVNAHERLERQRVYLTLTLYPNDDHHHDHYDHDDDSGNDTADSRPLPYPFHYRTVARVVQEFAERTRFQTVEALATHVARVIIQQCHHHRVTVQLRKPSALLFAEAAGIELTRTSHDFPDPSDEEEHVVVEEVATSTTTTTTTASSSGIITAPTTPGSNDKSSPASTQLPLAPLPPPPPLPSRQQPPPPPERPDTPASLEAAVGRAGRAVSEDGRWRVAYVAVGSNVGDRVGHIGGAVDRVAAHPMCNVVDTSFLYESPAAYVTDQPSFLNAVIKVRPSPGGFGSRCSPAVVYSHLLIHPLTHSLAHSPTQPTSLAYTRKPNGNQKDHHPTPAGGAACHVQGGGGGARSEGAFPAWST